MSTPRSGAILNTALPSSFRQIRLVLAREPDHPAGDDDIAYTIVAPLTVDGLIDANLWKKYREACRVVRQRPGQGDALGHLVHRQGGSWAIRYDISGNVPDEAGYHFGEEHFVVGEYVSLNEDGEMRTFRVASASPL
jgi:hypothetical protein